MHFNASSARRIGLVPVEPCRVLSVPKPLRRWILLQFLSSSLQMASNCAPVPEGIFRFEVQAVRRDARATEQDAAAGSGAVESLGQIVHVAPSRCVRPPIRSFRNRSGTNAPRRWETGKDGFTVP